MAKSKETDIEKRLRSFPQAKGLKKALPAGRVKKKKRKEESIQPKSELSRTKSLILAAVRLWELKQKLR